MADRAPWSEDRARSILSEFQDMRGALLPMLHGLQEEFGCIDDPAIPLLADALNLSQAEVHGVVSFYEDFRTTRPGHHVLKVCRAEACQSMGAEALLAHAKAHLSVDRGETSADGVFTLETVFCLGNCALSPAVLIDEDLYGRVSPDRLDSLLADYREGAVA
ncbi:formate dehydrogenase subunit gamma [Rhodospirillum sp. A1_3_36]|uniref:formate dehydrogenase subunit gamma n=1 Tax=Rhodospirillum sp. A1_3_36 TaxID=3391666 RepID=UPI0039A6F991